MAPLSLSCERDGAPLDFDATTAVFRCAYCGSQYLLGEEVGRPRLVPVAVQSAINRESQARTLQAMRAEAAARLQRLREERDDLRAQIARGRSDLERGREDEERALRAQEREIQKGLVPVPRWWGYVLFGLVVGGLLVPEFLLFKYWIVPQVGQGLEQTFMPLNKSYLIGNVIGAIALVIVLFFALIAILIPVGINWALVHGVTWFAPRDARRAMLGDDNEHEARRQRLAETRALLSTLDRRWAERIEQIRREIPVLTERLDRTLVQTQRAADEVAGIDQALGTLAAR